jgi:hypothetical protein
MTQWHYTALLKINLVIKFNKLIASLYKTLIFTNAYLAPSIKINLRIFLLLKKSKILLSNPLGFSQKFNNLNLSLCYSFDSLI